MKKTLFSLIYICAGITLLPATTIADNTMTPLHYLVNLTTTDITCKATILTSDQKFDLSFDGTKSPQSKQTDFRPYLRCTDGSHASINFMYQTQNTDKTTVASSSKTPNWVAVDDKGKLLSANYYQCQFTQDKLHHTIPSCSIMKLAPSVPPTQDTDLATLSQITNKTNQNIDCTVPAKLKQSFTLAAWGRVDLGEYLPIIECQASGIQASEPPSVWLLYSSIRSGQEIIQSWKAYSPSQNSYYTKDYIDCGPDLKTQKSQCTFNGFDTGKITKPKSISISMPTRDDIKITHTDPNQGGPNWQALTTAKTNEDKTIPLNWASLVKFTNQNEKDNVKKYIVEYFDPNTVTPLEIIYLKNADYRAKNIIGITDLDRDDWLKLGKECDTISYATQHPYKNILLNACKLNGQKITKVSPSSPFDPKQKVQLTCSCELPSNRN